MFPSHRKDRTGGPVEKQFGLRLFAANKLKYSPQVRDNGDGETHVGLDLHFSLIDEHERVLPRAGEIMLRRILIVDDEPLVREVLITMMADQGFDALGVGSGEECLAALEGPETPFGLILVDMHMTGLSGVETCRAVRKIRPEIPILLISGINRESLDDSPIGDLVDGFIAKPFRFDELQRQVRRVLDLETTPFRVG
jgi:CheY-like chemotaxis protein